MSRLGIHQLCAVEVDALSFVSLAADAGCQEISVFTNLQGIQSAFPAVSEADRAAMEKRLNETGVRIANVEAFLITPNTDLEIYRPALELGATLGARGAVAQIFDADEKRVTEMLSGLCEMAGALGLEIAIEFMAFCPAWNSLDQAAALVRQLAQPNLRVGIDMLHLVRSGGSPADVATLEPGLIGYAQLCDSADPSETRDYVAEATANRLAPGDGVFPLAAVIEALPVGVPLELEVPQARDRPPQERIDHMVAAARAMIDAIRPPR